MTAHEKDLLLWGSIALILAFAIFRSTVGEIAQKMQ
jgi:hypothetical protein